MNDRLHGGLGRWFWISWTIAMAWSLYRCLTNQSWILDDELAHYLISKDVWESGKELWHPWSRPGRNILQFIPAHFGLTVARLWTLALAGLAIWLTGREGKRLGMTGLAVLPILVGFQWWFPELSYPDALYDRVDCGDFLRDAGSYGFGGLVLGISPFGKARGNRTFSDVRTLDYLWAGRICASSGKGKVARSRGSFSESVVVGILDLCAADRDERRERIDAWRVAFPDVL
mgnify:CR=1 FL=1